MRRVNVNVLSATDTASHNGLQIDSNQLLDVSFHAYFGDSTAVGTFKIQASNDIYQDQYQSSNFTVVNWVDIPSASVSVTAGASGLISLQNIAYRWIRAVWVYSSGGSSTITINMFATSVL